MGLRKAARMGCNASRIALDASGRGGVRVGSIASLRSELAIYLFLYYIY